MDLNDHYVSMHHVNMVRNLVAGLQDVIQQGPLPVEDPVVILETQY